jgi:Xaa-Pro aminopeptidase
MFSKATYVTRRNGLKSHLGSGLVLLLGNDDSSMNAAANTYPFRQDSSFLYYLGIDRPGLAAILDLDSGNETIFGDELTIDDIVWMGPQPSISSQAAAAGVEAVLPSDKLADTLAKARQQGRKIHFIPPYRPEHQLKYQALLGIAPAEQKAAASEALIRAIVAQRSIKSAEEVAEIEKAVRTTNRMHLTAMRLARPGMTEAELTGAVNGAAVAGGGNLSFPIILSKHGQILHNHHHGNTLQEGDLVLCDSGAEAPSRYAGDMTRAFPAGRSFSTRQKEIYQIVLDSLKAASAALKPGLPYKEVHLLASRVIASGLKELGLMKGDVEEAVAAGAHALFFPHGLGHMMGLDVHDMENLGEDYVGYDEQVQRSDQFGTAYLRLGRALQPGFVLTVEPGIYFIPELTEMWQKEGKHTAFINYEKVQTYLDFGGIRIEDDYLITETGGRLLGDPIAKTIAEVEAVRAEGMG